MLRQMIPDSSSHAETLAASLRVVYDEADETDSGAPGLSIGAMAL